METLITYEFAQAFAHSWLTYWNAHDLEKILSLYAEEFEISSPIASIICPKSKGHVVGKIAVRDYWRIGLERTPNLHFTVLDILIGIDSLTLYLQNDYSLKRSVEMMYFNDRLEVIRTSVNITEN